MDYKVCENLTRPSGSKCRCFEVQLSVPSNVPQGLMLELLLFNILMRAPGCGTECLLSVFTSDTRSVHWKESRAAIQRDLSNLEEWASRELEMFGKDKCALARWMKQLKELALCGPGQEKAKG